MELVQVTLRMPRELSERIKTHAKAIKKPVNTFLIQSVEKALNPNQNDSASAGLDPLTVLLADPFRTLADIHYKISDPWNTNEEIELESAEKLFLIEGAKKQLEHNDLRWPYYEDIKQQLNDSSEYLSFGFLRAIFGFALPYYLPEEHMRMRFAIKQSPSDIPTERYKISSGAFTFIIIFKGNEGPHPESVEFNRPPELQMIVETQRFDFRFGWDIFISLVRLMESVATGQASRCHKGGLVKLSRSADKEHPWYLYLGKLQLLLNDNELHDIARQIIFLLNTEGSNGFKQLSMLYGERW